MDAQITNARRTYNRSKQLFDEQVISQVELETDETALRQLEAQQQGLRADLEAVRQSVRGAGYNTKSSEASLRQARESLKRTNVYAPMSGIISQLSVKEGERVAGTAQFSGTEMLRIADFSRPWKYALT